MRTKRSRVIKRVTNRGTLVPGRVPTRVIRFGCLGVSYDHLGTHEQPLSALKMGADNGRAEVYLDITEK